MRRLHTAIGALGLTAATLAGAAGQAGATTTMPAQRTPSGVAGHRSFLAGRVLWVQPLAAKLWLPGAAKAYRVVYTSTDTRGRPVVATGAVFIPSARYTGKNARHGRPVVSYAHETVGLADPCAPSVAGRPDKANALMSRFLGKGYIVAAADYEGLGSPGEHPFLMGAAEAHSVVDMVRATRRMHVGASRTWLSVGHSQGGHAALFTGATVGEYAPELDYRGTVATAPVSQWRMALAAAKPFDPDATGNPFIPYLLSGLDTVDPGLLDESSILTPAGEELYRASRTNLCFPQFAATVRSQPAKNLYHFTTEQQQALLSGLEKYSEVPITKEAPVFIAQGTADTTVYPPASQTTAKELAAAGTDVRFTYYPGADHGGVEDAASDDILAWVDQHLQ